MKPTKISYERNANLGNYESVKFSIEVELAEGDTTAKAMEASKKTVDKFIAVEIETNKTIKRNDKGARI